jgi:hypothetical protein
MPRDFKASENQKRSKARRAHALERLDLREPSVARESAVGATSHAVKARDPDVGAAVAEFLSRKGSVNEL